MIYGITLPEKTPYNKKSASALVSPDRHKGNHAGNLVFRSDSTYDPEGLGAGARHKNWVKIFYFPIIK
ncbi:hypothetical protein SAMN05216565_101126 [Litchfieldia salsa]|uniref:Uncharacterized protein n=1 Tax=Litchfieldia salsa TaxID=930152 RepID=A0A1H0P216_9BACI|nr:hypothetical protein SAMN05216565_101126 [Litchfieldia salsa]